MLLSRYTDVSNMVMRKQSIPPLKVNKFDFKKITVNCVCWGIGF